MLTATSIRFHKRRITVLMTAGHPPVEVDALVHGDWAVHRTPRYPDSTDTVVFDDWAVTFVPTGLKFPRTFSRRDHARAFVAGIPSLRLPRLVDKAGNDLSVRLSRAAKRRCQVGMDRLADSIETTATA